MSISERLNSILAMESKERRVRTAAGVDRFKQPINSIIVADAPVPNAISMPSRVVYGDSGIKGWIKASIDDEVFYIGRHEEGWVVQDETDLIIAEGDTSQQCDNFLEDLANPAKPLTAQALDKILKAAGHHTFKLLPAGVETQKKYTARNRNAMGTRDAWTTTFEGNGVYKVNVTGRNAKTRAEDMVDTARLNGLRVTDIVVMDTSSSFVVHNRNIKPLEGRLVWRGTGGQSVKPVVRTPPTAVPTDSNPRKEYRVPKKFYDDHIGRADNPSANPPKSSGAYYKVSLTKEEYDDLLSDADYYADGQGSGDFDPEMNWLLRSAAATLKALRESGPPSSETVAATPKSGGDGNSEKERLFAVEVDTKASEIYEKLIAAQGKMYSEESSVRRMSGQRSEYIGRSGNKRWVGTFFEALTALTKKIADAKAANSRTLLNQGAFQTVDDAERSISRYNSALTVVRRFEDEAAVQEAIWAKHRWNRAFLVLPDVGMGHVHKSRACSTTYPTTRWAWLPDYSGSDEARIVSDAGERACTICYPSAPVGTLDKPTKIYSKGELSAIDARKARNEERAQKLAETISKAATKNGDELVITLGGYRERFKTERSAMIWAVGAFGGYNNPREEQLAGIMVVAASIAEKRGVNISEVLQEIQDKGDAKRKRDYGPGFLAPRLVSGKGKKSIDLKHFEHDQSDHGNWSRKVNPAPMNTEQIWGYAPSNVKAAHTALYDKDAYEEFILRNDHGGGCEDIAFAVESRFDIPQVFGYHTTKGGVKEYHSWNQSDNGYILDAAQYVFGDGDGSRVAVYEPGNPRFQVNNEISEEKTARMFALDRIEAILETKERRVRTPEGRDRFKKPIGAIIDGVADKYVMFVDEIDPSLADALTPTAQESRDSWIYNFAWPNAYLDEVSQDQGYQEMLHSNLRRMGFGEEVTLRRRGKPSGPVTNASIFSDWQGAGYNGEMHEWTVPISSIIGVGHPDEGEVFVRQARPVTPRQKPQLDGLEGDLWDAEYDKFRVNDRAWSSDIKKGISLGIYDPQDARDAGWIGNSENWEPLPEGPLYHVTTAKSAVAIGGLKTRDEIGNLAGGLGGGESDSISLTDDLATARVILESMNGMHDVLSGRTSIADLMESARNGTDTDRPFDEILMSNLITSIGSTEAENLINGNESSDPKERLYRRYTAYQLFLAFREQAGGPMDPLFFGTDPETLLASNPSEFGIVEVNAKPGSMGYQMNALGEWRTGTGKALETVGILDDGQASYRMSHQPDISGPSVSDVENLYPGIYENPEWYSTGDPKSDRESLAVIKKVRGNPDAMVTVYRAAPQGVTTINPGDWVSLSRTYATEHGMHATDPAQDMPVISMEVPARSVVEGSGNSINEWGYQPVEDAEIDTKTLFERFYEIEEKVRHVIDAAYWGAPVGTPLPLPKKPDLELDGGYTGSTYVETISIAEEAALQATARLRARQAIIFADVAADITTAKRPVGVPSVDVIDTQRDAPKPKPWKALSVAQARRLFRKRAGYGLADNKDAIDAYIKEHDDYFTTNDFYYNGHVLVRVPKSVRANASASQQQKYDASLARIQATIDKLMELQPVSGNVTIGIDEEPIWQFMNSVNKHSRPRLTEEALRAQLANGLTDRSDFSLAGTRFEDNNLVAVFTNDTHHAIWINPRSLFNAPKKNSKDYHVIPLNNQLAALEYTLVHEWGHLLPGTESMDRDPASTGRYKISEYAMNNIAEYVAEAFTWWFYDDDFVYSTAMKETGSLWSERYDGSLRKRDLTRKRHAVALIARKMGFGNQTKASSRAEVYLENMTNGDHGKCHIVDDVSGMDVLGTGYLGGLNETKTLFERFYEIEEKVRNVVDSEYWGMPVDTPITPGMKPKKKKASDYVPSIVGPDSNGSYEVGINGHQYRLVFQAEEETWRMFEGSKPVSASFRDKDQAVKLLVEREKRVDDFISKIRPHTPKPIKNPDSRPYELSPSVYLREYIGANTSYWGLGKNGHEYESLDTLKKELFDAIAAKEYSLNASRPIFIDVTVDSFLKIIANRRMKNAHEADTGSKRESRSKYMRIRNSYERQIMGVPSDTPASKKPIYGYSKFDAQAKRGWYNYGSVKIRLKDRVKGRSTMSAGDSLDGKVNPVWMSDVLDGNISSPEALWHASSDEYRESAREVVNGKSKSTYTDYWEVQIHGGVTLEDIDSIEMSESDYLKLPAAKKKALEDSEVQIWLV